MNDAEHEVFEAFVRARYPELVRFARALTGSAEDGADLLHDALASTVCAWRRVESRGDPEGYVRRAMVNRNISLWRRRSRERSYLAEAIDPAAVADSDWGLSLWAAIRGLPPRQRTVIALRFYEELSVSEVAATMGCSEGTVKSQTAKALAKLREALGQDALGGRASRGQIHE